MLKEMYLIDQIYNDMIINTKKVLNFGNGYLTYIVGVCMVVAGWYNEDTKLVLEGIGLLGIRRALANK